MLCKYFITDLFLLLLTICLFVFIFHTTPKIIWEFKVIYCKPKNVDDAAFETKKKYIYFFCYPCL